MVGPGGPEDASSGILGPLSRRLVGSAGAESGSASERWGSTCRAVRALVTRPWTSSVYRRAGCPTAEGRRFLATGRDCLN